MDGMDEAQGQPVTFVLEHVEVAGLANGAIVLALYSEDGYALPVVLSVARARAIGQALIDAATAVEALRDRSARWD